MLVRDAMSPPAVVLSPEMSVREASSALAEARALVAPVLEDGALAGIVTEIDLLRDQFEPDPRAWARPVAEAAAPPPLSVAEVMTREVVTTTENSDVAAMAERMVRSRVRAVPVLRGGSLVGMISRSDILRVHARPDEEIRAELRSALEQGAPYADGWTVRVVEGVAHLSGPGRESEAPLVTRIARTVPGVTRVLVDS